METQYGGRVGPKERSQEQSYVGHLGKQHSRNKGKEWVSK